MITSSTISTKYLSSPKQVAKFLCEKDPVIMNPIVVNAKYHELPEKRTIPKFKEDEDQFVSSLNTASNLDPGNSSALKNFFEYGVYRC